MNLSQYSFIPIYTMLVALLAHLHSFAEDKVTFNAHVHGVSELTIALEKQQLEIEMRSPAMNLLGFEHSAITRTDKAAINQAELLLANHHDVFSFSGGDCVLVNQFIDVSSVIQTQQEKNDQHIDSHNHRDDHHHEQKISESAGHREVIAKYHYRCKKSSTLSAIKIKLFDLFSGIEQIKAMWLTELQQGASTLNINNKNIILK